MLLAVDGKTALTQPDALLNRWRQHCQTLLNVEASTDDGILSQNEALSLRTDQDSPPTLTEIEIAIEKTKPNNAPGIGEVPAEAYKPWESS